MRKTKKESTDAFLFIWSGKRGSNSRPIPWQGIALPTELFPRKLFETDRKLATVLNLHHLEVRPRVELG